MLAELAQAASMLKLAGDMTKAAADLNRRAEIHDAIADARQKLLDATTSAMEQQEEVAKVRAKLQELEAENRRLLDWTKEAPAYELRQVATGIFVRLLKSYEGPYADAQKLCPSCFERATKSYLQQERVVVPNMGAAKRLKCFSPGCKVELTFTGYRDPALAVGGQANGG